MMTIIDSDKNLFFSIGTKITKLNQLLKSYSANLILQSVVVPMVKFLLNFVSDNRQY